MKPLPLSSLQQRAEQPVLTSSLIAKAVNKSLDEVPPSGHACQWEHIQYTEHRPALSLVCSYVLTAGEHYLLC